MSRQSIANRPESALAIETMPEKSRRQEVTFSPQGIRPNSLFQKSSSKSFHLIFPYIPRQTRFILPGPSGGSEKVLTIDEVRDAIKNVQNMELAHEIAINPDFRLQPFNPPEGSVGHRVKTVLHEAYWDRLREDLNAIPPVYDHAIALLGDVREVF